MAQIGNKQNSYCNGQWGKHARKRTGDKRYGSKVRRRIGQSICAAWYDVERKKGR